MNIWRFGQLHTEHILDFRREKKLSFNWLNPSINYRRIALSEIQSGRTCIDPWVNKLKEGDLIFLINKFHYAGVAIVKGEYKFKDNDFKVGNYTLPGITVKFLHLLNNPIEHNFNISSTNPKVFCRLNLFGIDLQKVLRLIKESFPEEYATIIDYINNYAPYELNKIARICWNTNGWVQPSGPLGKAPTFSHEKNFGFGHEEWLFDTNKIIDGYQYGFLEPVRKFQNKYSGHIYNILLFTRDSVTEQKYWVGCLKNVEILSPLLAHQAIDTFRNIDLIENMRMQLNEVGLNGNDLTNELIKEDRIVNIRFKVEEIQNIFESPIPVDEQDDRITSLYYVLLDWNGKLELPEIENEDKDYFNTGNHGEKKLKSKTKSFYTHSSKEVDLLHNRISDSFLKTLSNKYGKDKVKRECRVTGNNRIDMVVRDSGGDIFYEIKTFPQLKTCLRYALGQLIEYSCYPDTQKAKQYFLVSNIKANNEFIKYLNHLNSLYKMKIGYINFNLENERIEQIL